MDKVNPKHFILGGLIVAVAGFLMIDGYVTSWGPIENVMHDNISVGGTDIPYRYVLICAVLLIGYGAYKLWGEKH